MNVSKPMSPDHRERYERASSLVDILDRVLDKGLVVAGDINVSLADVELLTIGIRLLICSLDKAEDIGLDWWKFDPRLSPGRRVRSAERSEMHREIRALKQQVTSLTRQALRAGAVPRPPRASRPAHRRNAQGATHGR